MQKALNPSSLESFQDLLIEFKNHTSSSISKFWFSLSFFSVENLLIFPKKIFVEEIWLGDQFDF